jgi:hypothetical protein
VCNHDGLNEHTIRDGIKTMITMIGFNPRSGLGGRHDFTQSMIELKPALKEAHWAGIWIHFYFGLTMLGCAKS